MPIYYKTTGGKKILQVNFPSFLGA